MIFAIRLRLNPIVAAVASVFLSVALLVMERPASAQQSYLAGQTLRVIEGRQPGGLGDMRTRTVVKFLSKHLPGNPNIIIEYMPGGGGRKAANYLYSAVRPDGLTIANIGAGFLSNAVLGASGVNYDIDKMVYLGTGNSKSSYVFTTRKPAGFDSLEKLLRSKGVRIGALSVGHDIYISARMFAWILGLKDTRFIPGFSGPELDLAVINGEVDARVNVSDSVVHRSGHWIEKNLVDFHAMFEIPTGYRMDHPAFAKLPSLQSLAKRPIHKKVLSMARNFRLVGSPYLLGPGVPADRVKVLQDAFHKVFTDPALSKTWEEITGEPASPLTPTEQEKAIKEMPHETETIDVFKKLAGAGPLPPQ